MISSAAICIIRIMINSRARFIRRRESAGQPKTRFSHSRVDWQKLPILTCARGFFLIRIIPFFTKTYQCSPASIYGSESVGSCRFSVVSGRKFSGCDLDGRYSMDNAGAVEVR